MQMTISIITGFVLLLISVWLLVQSHGNRHSILRSFGFGAFAMALAAWFNYSRWENAPLWLTPVFGAGGIVLLGLVVHIFRLGRRLTAATDKPDLLDMITDSLVARFKK